MPRLIKEKELPGITNLSISELPRKEVDTLCGNLIHTVVHVFGRVNQDSTNTSLAPSSDKDSKKKKTDPNAPESKHHNRADVRKKRSEGHGRTQVLKTDIVEPIKPLACIDCQSDFIASALKCYTASYQIDLSKVDDEGYYRVIQTKFSLYDGYCAECGTTTRATISALRTDADGIGVQKSFVVLVNL